MKIMNGKFYVIIALLSSLSGCFFNNSEDKTKHTYFIQAPFDERIVSQIQENMSSTINNIIEEEAQVKLDKDVPLFFFKKRAAITVYYVNDMYVNAEPILFSSLEAMENIPAPQNVSISSKVDFFGEPKEDLMALIDLVVQIDDPDGGLFLFNNEAKELVHAANELYKSIHHIDMYDIARSERHSYLPHLSLGHLRLNYIKHLINDVSKAEKVIERIKQRIIETASQVLSELPLENRKIFFDTLSIYDLQKRIYIKNYVLKS
jgi:hypothetical protein